MELPETRYARTADGVSIAYQVVGDGPPDIVLVHSAFVSNMEIAWEWPFMGGSSMAWRPGAGSSCSIGGEPGFPMA